MEANTPLEELVIALDLDQSGAAKFIHFPDLAIEHVLTQIKQKDHIKQYTSFYFMVAKNFCDQNELSYDRDLYKAAQQKYGYQSKKIYEPPKKVITSTKYYQPKECTLDFDLECYKAHQAILAGRVAKGYELTYPGYIEWLLRQDIEKILEIEIYLGIKIKDVGNNIDYRVSIL